MWNLLFICVQHDSQEFLAMLLDNLHEHCSTDSFSVINDTFQGELRNEVIICSRTVFDYLIVCVCVCAFVSLVCFHFSGGVYRM